MSEEPVAYQIAKAVSRFRAVFFPDGWIAFCYDAERDIVEIQRRGRKYYFDLRAIREQGIDKVHEIR